MKQSILGFVGLTFLVTAPSVRSEEKPVTVTFSIHGAHCEECVKPIRTGIQKLKGVKLKVADIKPAAKPRKLRPRYFSPPFSVTIANERETNVGAFAAAVKKAKTRHAEEFETGINLLLYTKTQMSEELVMEMRSALRDVNGVEVDASGGLGAVFKKKYFWIRLEDAGGAELKLILDAAKKVDKEIATKPPKKT